MAKSVKDTIESKKLQRNLNNEEFNGLEILIYDWNDLGYFVSWGQHKIKIFLF